MGNFYVNFAVKNAEPQKVANSLKGRRAIVTPSQAGFVVVYDEQADTQAVDAIQELGALLSKDPGEPVLAVLNHDDDILCYWLFKEGALIDAYNSAPDSFEEGAEEQGGDAELLCATLGEGSAEEVDELLRSDHVFAVDLHTKLGEALKLPACSIGLGFEYVRQGEIEDDAIEGGLIQVGE